MTTSLHVLIVDDHRLFVDGLSHVVQQIDPAAKVEVATNVTRALEFIDANPSINLVLLDIHLPDLDGFDFLDACRRRALSVPVVVISGEADSVLASRAIGAGAQGYIPKSASAASLQIGIATVLRGERYLPEGIDSSPRQQRTADVATTNLSPRQQDVLHYIQRGCSNQQIADILNLAEPTVKTHITNLFRLLGVRNRTSCVREAVRLGLLESSVDTDETPPKV